MGRRIGEMQIWFFVPPALDNVQRSVNVAVHLENPTEEVPATM